MPAEPRWLTAEDVIAIARAEIESTGDRFVLNDGYTEAAVVRAQNLWHYEGERDIVSLSVSLLFAVAMSHAFKDGNKRTGFYAAVVFLEMNGYSVPNIDTDDLAEIIIAVIEGRLRQDQFEEAFRAELEGLQ